MKKGLKIFSYILFCYLTVTVVFAVIISLRSIQGFENLGKNLIRFLNWIPEFNGVYAKFYKDVPLIIILISIGVILGVTCIGVVIKNSKQIISWFKSQKSKTKSSRIAALEKEIEELKKNKS